MKRLVRDFAAFALLGFGLGVADKLSGFTPLVLCTLVFGVPAVLLLDLDRRSP